MYMTAFKILILNQYYNMTIKEGKVFFVDNCTIMTILP